MSQINVRPGRARASLCNRKPEGRITLTQAYPFGHWQNPGSGALQGLDMRLCAVCSYALGLGCHGFLCSIEIKERNRSVKAGLLLANPEKLGHRPLPRACGLGWHQQRSLLRHGLAHSPVRGQPSSPIAGRTRLPWSCAVLREWHGVQSGCSDSRRLSSAPFM